MKTKFKTFISILLVLFLSLCITSCFKKETEVIGSTEVVREIPNTFVTDSTVWEK